MTSEREMRRFNRYMRKILKTGKVESLLFDAEHYAQAGLLFSPLAGMPQIEAYELINKWNINQVKQEFVYGLEVIP